MKSLNSAMAFMKDWDGAFDGRDKDRFAEFVPFERLDDAGLVPQDGMTAEKWGIVREWTE